MEKNRVYKQIKEKIFLKVDVASLNLSAVLVVVSFAIFLAILIPVQVMSMAPTQFVIRDKAPLSILPSTILVYGIIGAILLLIYFFPMN